jgi:purine-nucleoside phosphorylase
LAVPREIVFFKIKSCMSLHLEAQPNDIAPTVLIAGDPLRAKFYAEHFLTDAYCYNRIRSMFGFSGRYNGKRVSLQGTGIGIPSTALYVNELIHHYGVKRIIRIGTCGALAADLEIGQVVVGTEGLSDSAAVATFHPHPAVFPAAHPGLLQQSVSVAEQRQLPLQLGRIFSTDLFYSPDSQRYPVAAAQGVVAVDMETSMLYAMGKYYGIETLSILTVTDHIMTGAAATPDIREKQTHAMVELALALIA